MTQKTDITESEWRAVLGNEYERRNTPPANGKLIEEIAAIWKLGIHHSHRRVLDMVRDGLATRSKVGRRVYYSLVNTNKK